MCHVWLLFLPGRHQGSGPKVRAQGPSIAGDLLEASSGLQPTTSAAVGNTPMCPGLARTNTRTLPWIQVHITNACVARGHIAFVLCAGYQLVLWHCVSGGCCSLCAASSALPIVYHILQGRDLDCEGGISPVCARPFISSALACGSSPSQVTTRTPGKFGRPIPVLFLHMSAGGAFGGARGIQAKAPEKGIFPLDHFGECTEVRYQNAGAHLDTTAQTRTYVWPLPLGQCC